MSFGNIGGIDLVRNQDVHKIDEIEVSSGTISVRRSEMQHFLREGIQAYYMSTGRITRHEPSRVYAYRDQLPRQVYDYAPFCEVTTDFYNYIKIVAYEHPDNVYNAGTKYLEYTKEALHKIQSIFDKVVTYEYAAGIKVHSRLYAQTDSYTW